MTSTVSCKKLDLRSIGMWLPNFCATVAMVQMLFSWQQNSLPGEYQARELFTSFFGQEF